jgi:uncharacterized membrane protein
MNRKDEQLRGKLTLKSWVNLTLSTILDGQHWFRYFENVLY